jgi:hypothetical protein
LSVKAEKELVPSTDDMVSRAVVRQVRDYAWGQHSRPSVKQRLHGTI